MHVVIMPPSVGGLKSYVIATDEYGGMKFVTENDSFEILDWKAVRFTTARDAIAFAERHGWTVMNKASSDTIWNPPMRKKMAEHYGWIVINKQALANTKQHFDKSRRTPRVPDKCGQSPALSGILAPIADSAYGGFVRQVPPLPVTQTVRRQGVNYWEKHIFGTI